MARPIITTVLAAVFVFLILKVSFLTPAAPGNILSGTLKQSGNHGDQYLLGVGKADITGPVGEINFMGYADPNQVGAGVRQRLFSRAFIVGELKNPSDRFVYLVLDTQSGDTATRHGILQGLKALGPEYAMYGEQNVAVTGTHSHSGPGAWLNYLLPQITSYGFHRQSYEAIVNGTIQSIKRAHESLTPGRLTVGTADVLDTNINRSPYAYLANPADERSRYKYDVDKTMTALRFRRDRDNRDIGILTWFPVHGTSMHGNNTFVTADNKGVAAALFEQYARGQTTATADFVAGFSQTNVGDSSPNTMGAYCESGEDAGKECDSKTSLCNGEAGPCHGRGPHWGLDDAGAASTYETGERQFIGARKIYESIVRRASSSLPLTGGSLVRSLHVYTDFAGREFELPNGTTARTCAAALGYSFAAGTTDGPGAFDFKQNNPDDPDANPVWAAVRDMLHSPSAEQVECHGRKPILLDVGETTKPYQWAPNIVDIQLLRVGPLFIIASPGEATTMSGRRWKESIASAALQQFPEMQPNDQAKSDPQGPLVVLGGPANSYTHYIATAEEYDIQRYEGASTLYGPHTLAAYIDLTTKLLPYLSPSSVSSSDPDKPPSVDSHPELDPGPSPPINVDNSLSFITPVLYDAPMFLLDFGEIIDDVMPSYALNDSSTPPVINITFIGANPRNNLRLGGTYAAVEHYDTGTGVWYRVRDDSHWSLLFQWEYVNKALGASKVTISWDIGWEIGEWGRMDRRHDPSMSDGLLSGGLDPAQQASSGGEDKAELAKRIREKRQKAKKNKIESLKGRYRIRYYGDWKALTTGEITPFEGLSKEFVII